MVRSHAAAALLALCAGAFSAGSAAADPIGPSVELWIGGGIHSTIDCGDAGILSGVSCDSKGRMTLSNVSVALGLEGLVIFGIGPGGVALDMVLDPDPKISYSMSVIDFGAPSSFSFIFSQGIVPTGTPGIASHHHESNTSDGGVNGVSVTPLAPPGLIPVDGDATPEIAVFSLSTNGGTSFLNPGLDLSPAFSGAAGTSDTQGPFDESGPGPAGSGIYDLMRVDVNFSMGGGNDAYALSGVAEIVPEPATAMLLGLGLLGLGIAGRREG